MNKPVILAVVQDPDLKQIIHTHLHNQSAQVVEASCYRDVLQHYDLLKFQLLILESPWVDGEDTLKLAELIRSRDRRFPIILVTSSGSKKLAISALRLGLKDYFEFPFPTCELIQAVTRCLDIRRRLACSVETSGLSGMQQLIGSSRAMANLKSYLPKAAGVDSHVLITGETGTGKELTAQFIHRQSKRANQPFVAINCAAMPDGLLESELFGYEKGAFTGAQSDHMGKLKMAHGGTVFFDEIGDMSCLAQAKILRLLETKEIYPLGGKRSVPLDIRIIAATNRNLEKMLLTKEFRDDLYFRLNVARVRLPSLRERKEDIPDLLNYYLKYFNKRFGQNLLGFSVEALAAFLHYHWPGNVRELKNVLESIFINCPVERITLNDLPEPIGEGMALEDIAEKSERERMLETLSAVKWNKSRAAEQLSWSRMTLYRKMEKYHIRDN
ncbi:sigma-54 dependent transcriptional regulator [Methylicorpusculum oleiharenae]|uniref:sigma-54 dependent transcriptional regulator n=1 Tax=Methylicorpusculum oleiharenae TaxID=1338687 RepID=UPI00135B9644|nr:sigma-54 dependent transcriptional regulator [Methylicorpusculum oleiharenae]MCD2449910.1 sigma-54 dependent transcriptional regulator [Methylicorpusculum oleiharenae]